MSPTRRALLALTSGFVVVAACTPSSSTTVGPRVTADSTSAPPPVPLPPPPPVADETAPPYPVTPQAPPSYAAVPPPPARPVYVPPPSGPYRVRIVDASHQSLPVYTKGGRSYVMGSVGSRYAIVIDNPTPARVEAVVSVDGLDAMDGHPADFVQKRGYIVPAYGSTDVDGFRTSVDDVATFRFSSVADSYAGRLGQARDVGVIGVAFFPERAPVIVRQAPPPPYDIAPGYGGLPAPAPATADRLGPAPAEPSGGGGGARAGAATRRAERPGLGTEYGEARESRVQMIDFARQDPTNPSQLFAIRYNSRAGLIALGIAIAPPYSVAENDLRLRETADPFRQNHFAAPPP